MTNNIIIKKIPSDWEMLARKKVRQGVYILYLGETDNEAGRRLILPIRKGKEISPGYFVRVSELVREHPKLIMGISREDFSWYELELREQFLSGGKAWKVKDISEEHYKQLLEASITANKATELLHSNQDL